MPAKKDIDEPQSEQEEDNHNHVQVLELGCWFGVDAWWDYRRGGINTALTQHNVQYSSHFVTKSALSSQLNELS